MTNIKLIIHSVLYTLFAVSLTLNVLVYNGYLVMPPEKSVEHVTNEQLKDIFTKKGK